MTSTQGKVAITDTASVQINSLPIAVYICNTNGYITAYNTAAAKLWGTQPPAGKTKWCGAHRAYSANGLPLMPEQNAAARTMLTGVAVTGDEVIIERPDGTTSYVLHHPVIMYGEGGEITGITNTLIDITAQKQNESKQAMLAAIVQSSDDAIISKTLDGIITSWNQAAEKLFGYTEQEAIGRSIIMVIPYDRLSEEELIIDRVRNNMGVEHFETLRKHKNRTLIPISLTVSPIKDSKGNVIGASKIARDISRQKQAEEQLQHYAKNLEILNSFGKEISEDLDVQGILQKVTDATTQLTGAKFGAFFYNKLNENGEAYMLYTLSGATKEAFEKLGMPRNTAVFKPTFKGEGIIRVNDITKDPRYGNNAPHNGMPTGHLPVVSYMAVPVISKDGTVIGGLLYGHPEAGKFTHEHELLITGVASQAAVSLDNAKLYEEVRMLNAKKDEFIGLASHELKTPVTSINGYLQIIERSLPGNDRNTAFIAKARMQVSKLSSLIADLLDVSKIITGQLPLSHSDFDLGELLAESVEILQQTHISHTLTIEDNGKPLTINADQQRVEQVIINLVSNAVKYSPDASKVNIKLFERDGYAVVAIQDFGIGIDQDDHERIFSRFYRVDNIAAHISGLGIGLYICNEIISRHKGRLWVHSELGQGSTFYFELPLRA
ncbi:PAS domain S-box protein [Mucilaginibacter sp. UR6-1]|uniref:PAS domain S-box protein n=1 Tax=Mucilaginibacter sp. UR6-1 TaxID=1435643 RepID=UPI001E396CF2|nr:PAS domain S-box protein [Mucilaginibacter sp. UR6-1]MCC8408977.1 PAS domain S-box protein [Mucilaginibacter sp. UR6-1]